MAHSANQEIRPNPGASATEIRNTSFVNIPPRVIISSGTNPPLEAQKNINTNNSVVLTNNPISTNGGVVSGPSPLQNIQDAISEMLKSIRESGAGEKLPPFSSMVMPQAQPGMAPGSSTQTPTRTTNVVQAPHGSGSAVQPADRPLPSEVNASGKIKRPMNAFMVWAREYRNVLSKGFPEDSNSQISIRLGDIWSNLSNAEKRPFYDRADELKRQHEKDHPDWVYQPNKKKRLSSNGSPPNNPQHYTVVAPRQQTTTAGIAKNVKILPKPTFPPPGQANQPMMPPPNPMYYTGPSGQPVMPNQYIGPGTPHPAPGQGWGYQPVKRVYQATMGSPQLPPPPMAAAPTPCAPSYQYQAPQQATAPNAALTQPAGPSYASPKQQAYGASVPGPEASPLAADKFQTLLTKHPLTNVIGELSPDPQKNAAPKPKRKIKPKQQRKPRKRSPRSTSSSNGQAAPAAYTSPSWSCMGSPYGPMPAVMYPPYPTAATNMQVRPNFSTPVMQPGFVVPQAISAMMGGPMLSPGVPMVGQYPPSQQMRPNYSLPPPPLMFPSQPGAVTYPAQPDRPTAATNESARHSIQLKREPGTCNDNSNNANYSSNMTGCNSGSNYINNLTSNKNVTNVGGGNFSGVQNSNSYGYGAVYASPGQQTQSVGGQSNQVPNPHSYGFGAIFGSSAQQAQPIRGNTNEVTNPNNYGHGTRSASGGQPNQSYAPAATTTKVGPVAPVNVTAANPMGVRSSNREGINKPMSNGQSSEPMLQINYYNSRKVDGPNKSDNPQSGMTARQELGTTAQNVTTSSVLPLQQTAQANCNQREAEGIHSSHQLGAQHQANPAQTLKKQPQMNMPQQDGSAHRNIFQNQDVAPRNSYDAVALRQPSHSLPAQMVQYPSQIRQPPHSVLAQTIQYPSQVPQGGANDVRDRKEVAGVTNFPSQAEQPQLVDNSAGRANTQRTAETTNIKAVAQPQQPSPPKTVEAPAPARQEIQVDLSQQEFILIGDTYYQIVRQHQSENVQSTTASGVPQNLQSNNIHTQQVTQTPCDEAGGAYEERAAQGVTSIASEVTVEGTQLNGPQDTGSNHNNNNLSEHEQTRTQVHRGENPSTEKKSQNKLVENPTTGEVDGLPNNSNGFQRQEPHVIHRSRPETTVPGACVGQSYTLETGIATTTETTANGACEMAPLPRNKSFLQALQAPISESEAADQLTRLIYPPTRPEAIMVKETAEAQVPKTKNDVSPAEYISTAMIQSDICPDADDPSRHEDSLTGHAFQKEVEVEQGYESSDQNRVFVLSESSSGTVRSGVKETEVTYAELQTCSEASYTTPTGSSQTTYMTPVTLTPNKGHGSGGDKVTLNESFSTDFTGRNGIPEKMFQTPPSSTDQSRSSDDSLLQEQCQKPIDLAIVSANAYGSGVSPDEGKLPQGCGTYLVDLPSKEILVRTDGWNVEKCEQMRQGQKNLGDQKTLVQLKKAHDSLIKHQQNGGDSYNPGQN